ncbi:MAG: type VI secretion system baseplate subunit TssE [Thiohalomonadales bacterium]
MHEGRLLERIEKYHDTGERTNEISESVLIASITSHVRSILNVRQGSVMTRLDYGLADINDVTSNYREAITIIRNSIQYCIENFEPRLVNVVVIHSRDYDSPLQLRFDISGDIRYGNRSTKIWFETIMNPTGRVMVKS